MEMDIKILNELKRYNQINKYINEQELPPPPADAGALPPPPADAGALPPPPGDVGALPPPPADPTATPADPTATPGGGEIPEPIDVQNDPDVEKIGDDKKNKKEVEITDLVNSQKKLGNKQEEYFDQLFKHLSNLENKLGEMDNIVNKLNDLESKVEKYRTKSPEEKLELRSLDSGPFNQKLSQYFEDKEDEFEKQGRDEYILTQDEVEDYSPSDIKKSFRNFEDFNQTDNFKKLQ